MTDGEICIITGANSGLGKQTAKELAKKGYTIIMVCRNRERGESAREEIIEYSLNEKVELFIADLSKKDDITSFVKKFLETYSRVDVLINNAGILLFKQKKTEKGIEKTFMVNYLASFLLTHLLLKTLKESAPSRIVNLCSSYHSKGKIRFKDLWGDKRYLGFRAYSQSKLAIVMFTYELDRRIEGKGITVNCVHPGIINTNITRHTGLIARKLAPLFLKSVKKGAKPIVDLASSPEFEGVSGKYYSKKKFKKSSKKSYNKRKAKRLWELSLELLNIEDKTQEL